MKFINMEEEIMNNKESIKYANMAIFSAVMAYEPKEVKALFNLASQRAGLRIGVDIMDRTKESYENLKKLILMHFPLFPREQQTVMFLFVRSFEDCESIL